MSVNKGVILENADSKDSTTTPSTYIAQNVVAQHGQAPRAAINVSPVSPLVMFSEMRN